MLLHQDPCTLKRLAPSEFTKGLIIELRKVHGNFSLRMIEQLKCLAPFELLPQISDCNDSSLRSKAEKAWKHYTKLNRDTKKDRKQKVTAFLKEAIELPRSRAQPSEAVPLASATQSKLNQARQDLKHYKRRCAQVEHENEQLEERYEWLTQQYYEIVSQLHTNADHFQKVIAEKSSDVSEIRKTLAAEDKRNSELTAKLDSLQVRLAKTGSVRNVNKKLKRREEKIQQQEDTIEELQTAVSACSELREAKALAEEKQARSEEKLSGLQKKVKSLQDGRRKLELKLQKEEDDKVKMAADLEATISALQENLDKLRKENTELQEIQALLESETVTTFHEGRYSDEVREVVMDLLTLGVSMKKVDSVITSVLKNLAGMTVERLPSIGLKSRLLVEAKILAQRQVAEAILSGVGQPEIGNCLHQDGTSKYFRKYQTFDVTLADKRTMTMSMSEISSGTAAGITEAFSQACKELAEVLCTTGEGVAEKTAQIVASFTSTMSDRGATNPLFNKELEELRRELLPVAEKNWDTFSDEVKDELASV